MANFVFPKQNEFVWKHESIPQIHTPEYQNYFYQCPLLLIVLFFRKYQYAITVSELVDCPSLKIVHMFLLFFPFYTLSVYQIVVEEERPRRTKKTTEILKCYPVPIHFQNASLLNSQYYFAAEFPANGLQAAQPFTVGDNKTYSGFWNTPLLPHKSYSIYFQAASRANGVSLITGVVLHSICV